MKRDKQGRENGAAPTRMRLDLWLCRARMFKTRAAAAGFVAAEGVRISQGGISRLLDKPSALVNPGDGLIFRQGKTLRALTITALPARRGPAAEARAAYEEAIATPCELDAADSARHFLAAREEFE